MADLQPKSGITIRGEWGFHSQESFHRARFQRLLCRIVVIEVLHLTLFCKSKSRCSCFYKATFIKNWMSQIHCEIFSPKVPHQRLLPKSALPDIDSEKSAADCCFQDGLAKFISPECQSRWCLSHRPEVILFLRASKNDRSEIWTTKMKKTSQKF